MSLLYLLLVLLVLGGGAVWAFLWLVRNNKFGPARPHAHPSPASRRELGHGPAAKPGLEVKHGEAPAHGEAKPDEAAKRRAS